LTDWPGIYTSLPTRLSKRWQKHATKTLCQKADVPDKSGEMLTQEGAQHFIDDLKKQMAERKESER
jgi:hypothetical protein